jgi:large conductance mechanosensitive channel
MLKDFRDFVMRGNVLDMAVGIIIGAAFGTIVSSLVRDVIMPPIGWALGNVDFANLFFVIKEGKTAAPYHSLAEAQAAGAVSINYGVFINTIISFLIVALAVFFLIKMVQRARTQFEAKKVEAPAASTTKDCPFCFSKININARRCPNCTSQLTS